MKPPLLDLTYEISHLSRAEEVLRRLMVKGETASLRRDAATAHRALVRMFDADDKRRHPYGR